MSNKLNTRDLITIGIFSAIYIIAYVILSGILFTPILFMLLLPIGALLMAPVYMLLIARTQKPGAITILGFLCALIIGFIMYGNALIALVNFAIALLAELFAYIGKYKSFKWNTISYCTFSLWVIGQIGAYWVAKDWMRELTIASGYPVDWTDAVIAMATPLNLLLIMAGTVVCALISSFIANRMFKKHFVRAGIA